MSTKKLRNVTKMSIPSRSLALWAALSCILLLYASVSLPLVAAEPDGIVRLDQHYDGVLGTSLDMTLYATDTAQMESAAAAAVAEIARLEQILSTWLSDSELMQLNSSGVTRSASAELLEVTQLCENWYQSTEGVFSCRLGAFLALWDAAERDQAIPLVSAMLPVARAASAATVAIDATKGSIELDAGLSLDPSGLAKGYIIDRAMAVLRAALPQASGLKLDIGGDASYWGSPPGEQGWLVQVADPQNTADNAGFLTSLKLSSMAVATSGHTSRVRSINGRSFSHILDPRRGWPVVNGIYAVVLAADTTTADALATTLAVHNLEAALALASSIPDVAALLVTPDGTQRSTTNWKDFLSEEQQRQASASVQLKLDYTIPALDQRGYERPYVAIWISDARGSAIRNLLLLGGEQNWASTNTRWWNSTRQRRDSVTRPTRGPGSYQLLWDGRDDDGAVLPSGDYLLHLEASREDGGHSYKRVRLSLTEGSQTITEPGDGELGPFTVTLTVRLPEL